MKNLILFLLCSFAIVGTTNAQFEFDNFYGGATFGWAQPIGKFTEVASGGLCYNLEAGYRIIDKLGVGLEYANSATVDASVGNGLELNIYGVSQILIKANYRLFNRKFSPYGGLGLGYSRVSEPTIQNIVGAKRGGFGTVLEAGLDIYGVILAYRFNYGGSTPKEPVINTSAGNLPVTMHQFVVGYVYKLRSY